MDEAIQRYASNGWKVVIAEVDPKKVELLGGGRSSLSPIQFWTDKPYDTIPSTLGLLSIDQHQELLIYVLHPEKRFETKNYKLIFPPTNIEVDKKVHEKVGDFYTTLYDRLDKKHPGSFVGEYAWTTKECGQPCPNEPLLIHELLTLGGNVLEELVPEEERHPEPPELTEEEEEKQEEKFKEMKPVERIKAKKELEEERKEFERRKGVLKRQQYIMSRVHRRYDKNGLPQDVKIGPAAHPVRGGVDIPQGPGGKLPTAVKSAKENMLQVRYVRFRPWDGQVQCEKPQPGRWGKFWRHIRERRKIWVANDLARRSRKFKDLEQAIFTPIPELGIKGGQRPSKKADAGADAGAPGEDEAKDSRCGCRMVGSSEPAGGALGWLGLLGAAAAVRRRRSS